MLNEVHYQTVLKFFFFLLPDEDEALNFSSKVIKQINSHHKRNQNIKIDLIILNGLWEIYNRYQNRILQLINIESRHPWQPLQSDRAAAWRNYLKDSEPEVRAILVFRYILGYSPEFISEALNIPCGTVLYRMGRGLESVAGKLKSI